MPLLQARNVHRYLGQGETLTHILRGVNLLVEPGEFVSITGASGSGKSTLLYLLGGLDRPSLKDAADQPISPRPGIFIDSQDTLDLDEIELASVRNAKVGFIFQFHYLLREFTAQENVALPMFQLGKLSRDDALDRAAELLTRFGLGEKINRRTNKLSGGEQQRVAIARALANEPAVVLADEPTGNLDSKNAATVAQVFDELAANGQTLVMVTHDLTLADRARRRLKMEDGQIVSDSGSESGSESGATLSATQV